MAPLIFHPWSHSGAHRHAFGAFVFAVLAVHVFVLYLFGHRNLSLSQGVIAPGVTIQARVVSSMDSARAEPVAAVLDMQDTTTSQPLAQGNADLDHDALTQQATDSRTQVPSTALSSSLAGGRYDQLDYVPREFLSLTPTPLSAIEVPFPDSVTDELRIDVQLALFIDERGVVQRVRVEGAGLPPVLEDAAATAFRKARFTPGQVDGQPVRSLIKVAVTFESQAVKAADRAH